MKTTANKDYQTHVMTERTHLSQVRRAFTKSLADGHVDPGLINFYVVCCSYLDSSLKRLVTQDYILHDLLTPHIEPNNQEYIDKLDSLSNGLKAMEEALNKLSQAKEDLIKSGLYEVDIFKKEAHAFLDVFLNMLASNRHSTFELEEKVFQPSDWEKIAGVTKESIETEDKLYQSVLVSAPQGCDPSSFPPIGHNQKPQ